MRWLIAILPERRGGEFRPRPRARLTARDDDRGRPAPSRGQDAQRSAPSLRARGAGARRTGSAAAATQPAGTGPGRRGAPAAPQTARAERPGPGPGQGRRTVRRTAGQDPARRPEEEDQVECGPSRPGHRRALDPAGADQEPGRREIERQLDRRAGEPSGRAGRPPATTPRGPAPGRSRTHPAARHWSTNVLWRANSAPSQSAQELVGQGDRAEHEREEDQEDVLDAPPEDQRPVRSRS